MDLDNSLFHARKRSVLSQEEVAEKIGVSRQPDIELSEIQEIIDKSNAALEDKIDWTNAWGKKYPVLLKYQSEVNIPHYALGINTMLDELKQEYKLNEQDAMLVLKDILYNVWKIRKER